MLCVNVELETRAYPIYIGENILTDQSLYPLSKGDKVMIVTNPTVAQYYLECVSATLRSIGCEVNVVLLADGEQYKTLESLNQIYTALLEANYGRDCTLIALGGGVIGDICGFAASSYQRGVPFIQIPTTLLAQVDASVGGKTAVNHPLGKNMIGAFYQPQVVLIDTQSLHTLPMREVSAGLAEVIKYGAILDVNFFDWLELNIDALVQLDNHALKHAIFRCCQLKAQIVAEDERETGKRALLNFGHTFGHAIETHLGYGKWLHGEAVASGMMMAITLSVLIGNLSSLILERLRILLQQANLPYQTPIAMLPEDFLLHMKRDKKVQQGKLRLILLQNLGQAYVTSEIDQSLVLQAIALCKAEDSTF